MRDLLNNRELDSIAIKEAIDKHAPLRIGDPESTNLLLALSKRLITSPETRQIPELISLGFFLRRGEIENLLQELGNTAGGVIRVPRGLHFHIPPANVDTMFVYSWALSLICGNPNVVRISQRVGSTGSLLVEILREVLKESSTRLRETQFFVSLEHGDQGIADLSSLCAQRVIWGGDESIAEIRRHPLGPRSIELVFANRNSLAVIQAEAVNQLETESLESLIEQFVNDVWWFDQAACSSPRTLVWVGEPESTTAAREKFLRCLSRRLEIKRLGDDSAMAVQRRVALYGLAIENPQTQLDFQHHRFSFASFVPRPNSWLGAGAFVEIFLNQLCELSQFLNERDQTLTYFGVSSSELTDLVDDLQGTAIERIVPIGRALSFGRIWDGYNLLVHMTKSVSFIDIKSSAESRNR